MATLGNKIQVRIRELREIQACLFRTAGLERSVPLQDLPDPLRAALSAVGYRKRDVRIEQGTSFSPSEASAFFEGNRGYLVLVNLQTGQRKTFEGSFGGPSPNTQTLVDDDHSTHPIPSGFAVILGESGGRGNLAHIRMHPDNFAKDMLPENKQDLSEKEKSALNAVTFVSSYRRDEFLRSGLGVYGPENPYVQALAAKGLVKITGKAVAITTEGKNALRSR
jgi:hypothetical protein